MTTERCSQSAQDLAAARHEMTACHDDYADERKGPAAFAPPWPDTLRGESCHDEYRWTTSDIGRMNQHRIDEHNAEIDEDLVAIGLCGMTHLATGRRCHLPAHHHGSCEFVASSVPSR